MMKDYGLILGRIVTIFPLMLIITLFMGRRSIGELPVFDYLIILALGAVVGADIADPQIHHLPTAFAIIMIGIFQKIFSYAVIRFRKFGKRVTFEPIIVIHNGKLIYRNIKKARYTIENILQMLRQSQVFNLSIVDLAVIEPNGELSILEKSNAASSSSVVYPVIREGQIQSHVLPFFHLKEQWIHDQLRHKDVKLNEIFLATLDDQLHLHITRYTEQGHGHLPPLYQ
ncbi:DUF421 domain-containing protein [Paenibacillus lemnae]|nr:DUF421 domain-containing protein [Paenibacillus lemnae]